MEDIPLLGRADEHPLRKHFLTRYGPPAYVRRARRVQEAFDELVARCRRQRDEWLEMVRLRLALCHALAGRPDGLRPLLAEDSQLAVIEQLQRLTEPAHCLGSPPAPSPRRLRRALEELRESIVRFNQRWEAYLAAVDFGPVNEVRAGYNQYYVLEKECAVRSPVLARQGFRRLEPLTLADLLAVLPPLPALNLR